MVILLIGLVAGVPPALLTPLNWDRYYFLPVMFATIFSAIGLAVCITTAVQWSERKLVVGGPSVDQFLVVAGTGLYLVPRDAAGLERHDYRLLDNRRAPVPSRPWQLAQ